MLNKLILISLFLVSLCAYAETEPQKVSVEDYAFSHAYIAIEGGEIYPFGDLVDAVYNTYYGGLDFRYSYWENVDGVVMFHYSYFKPRPDGVPYDGNHQFSGKLGLDWRWPLIRPVIFGGGFTCNWVRADLDDGVDENRIYNLPGGTLGDNETEFGWYARLNLTIWNLENYRVGINVMWEELWTLPKRSEMLSVGLYVERRLW